MSLFLALTLLSVAIQGVFACFEMASVSFNKVRLEYLASLGKRRALWLQHLLKNPSRLFGTTLIGINTALVIGSECARRFYESMQIDPDWAPLTQVAIVLILGELAPMFAARRHSAQVAMFFVPVMMFLSRLLSPIIWGFDSISKWIHQGKEVSLFLSREEVKMAFEEKEAGEDEFSSVIQQIFQLKNLTARQWMFPIKDVLMVPSHTNLDEMRALLSAHYAPIVPIYHKIRHNVVGIVHLRDLLRMKEGKKILDQAHSPWFVTEDTSVLQILEQFRRNNQSAAVILDPLGLTAGILTLDEILSKIFGEEENLASPELLHPFYVERTLSANMSVREFNRQFKSDLSSKEGATLEDLMLNELDHPPVRGEVVRLGAFEFTVTELTLRGIKTLSVRSITLTNRY